MTPLSADALEAIAHGTHLVAASSSGTTLELLAENARLRSLAADLWRGGEALVAERDALAAAALAFLTEDGSRCNVSEDRDALATRHAASPTEDGRRLDLYRCDKHAPRGGLMLVWRDLPQAALVRLLGAE